MRRRARPGRVWVSSGSGRSVGARSVVPWWNTSPRPVARSQVTTSPTKITWSPARWREWWRHSNHADAAFDQRRVGPAQPVVDALEAVRVRPREAAREIALRGREHVDRVALRRLERGQARPTRCPRLHRTSGGCERDGVERVGGEADVAAVAGARADDRDARWRTAPARRGTGARRRPAGARSAPGADIGQWAAPGRRSRRCRCYGRVPQCQRGYGGGPRTCQSTAGDPEPTATYAPELPARGRNCYTAPCGQPRHSQTTDGASAATDHHRSLRRPRSCRSRSCCPTARACRCPRRRRSRSSRARGGACGRSPRRPWARSPAPTCTATSTSRAARGASSASPSRWSAPCRTAATARGPAWKLFLHQRRSNRAQHLAPLRRHQRVLPDVARPAHGVLVRVFQGRRRRRSTPRRRTSSTTSAASCGSRRGEQFLDIGCGWGALLFHAAEKLRRAGARHHAVAEPVRPRVAARSPRAGSQAACSVELRDYLDLPDDARYDKVASVGMFEHVGRRAASPRTSARSTAC